MPVLLFHVENSTSNFNIGMHPLIRMNSGNNWHALLGKYQMKKYDSQIIY
jgi:hypothetical protein